MCHTCMSLLHTCTCTAGNPTTLRGSVCVVHHWPVQPPEGGLPAQPALNARLHWNPQLTVRVVILTLILCVISSTITGYLHIYCMHSVLVPGIRTLAVILEFPSMYT